MIILGGYEHYARARAQRMRHLQLRHARHADIEGGDVGSQHMQAVLMRHFPKGNIV